MSHGHKVVSTGRQYDRVLENVTMLISQPFVHISINHGGHTKNHGSQMLVTIIPAYGDQERRAVGGLLANPSAVPETSCLVTVQKISQIKII